MSFERNPGIALDLDWVNAARVNRSAVERRASTLPGRRTVKSHWQAAWLVRAIQVIDLTTLGGDDTPGNVRRLCAKARHPMRADLAEALGVTGLGVTTGAVCVYHEMVETAVAALAGTQIPVAAVSAGFPAGLNPLDLRIEEIRRSVAASGVSRCASARCARATSPSRQKTMARVSRRRPPAASPPGARRPRAARAPSPESELKP